MAILVVTHKRPMGDLPTPGGRPQPPADWPPIRIGDRLATEIRRRIHELESHPLTRKERAELAALRDLLDAGGRRE